MSLDDELNKQKIEIASKLYRQNRDFYTPNRYSCVGEYLKGLAYALIPLSGMKKVHDFQERQRLVEAELMVDIAANQYHSSPEDRCAQVIEQSRKTASFIQSKHTFQSGFKHGVAAALMIWSVSVWYGDQESNSLINRVLPPIGVILAGLWVGDAVYHVCRRYRITFERMK